ncbi:MAG: TraB/GumN family protein [Bacteroidia bacterium]|nr:TraB/GumN family protein [Bacteroidia bacterium]
MKHLLLLILSVLGTPLLPQGFCQADTASVSVEKQPEEMGLFWEINRADLATPSYLYGTIHIIPKDSFFILPVVAEKLPLAQRLVLEIPLDMNMGTILSSTMQMFIPDGKTLKSLMTPEDYDFLTIFMRDSLSSPLPFYQRIKPIFISQHISSNYCYPTDMESYELYFSALFKEQNKPVSGLETVSEQMTYLNDMTMEEQVSSLVAAIRNPREGCDLFGKMIATYRKQDLNELMKMMGASEEVGEHLDQLLDARNKKWISQIETLVKAESVFIAVGAGHLGGNNGVVNLLRNQGYQLTPLR